MPIFQALPYDYNMDTLVEFGHDDVALAFVEDDNFYYIDFEELIEPATNPIPEMAEAEVQGARTPLTFAFPKNNMRAMGIMAMMLMEVAKKYKADAAAKQAA